MYEDTSDGDEGGNGDSPPVWKMELKSPSAADIGVAPSQIMDTGGSETSFLAAVIPLCCCRCGCEGGVGACWMCSTERPHPLPEVQMSFARTSR